ncbi:MAG: NAD-dependent epimerase/dehydratase family protein [Xenococcaceae cyanobacterium]
MTNNVFLTGGSGFVGMNIIPQLLDSGYMVYGLARSEDALKKVEAVGAKGVLGSLSDLKNAQKALENCQIVIHCAAYMNFTYEYEKFYNVNVQGTKNLVAAAKRAGLKKFIYISAASVINGKPVKNVDELYTPRRLPQDYYSKTKALAEKLVLETNEPGFEAIALRPPAIWGPNNPHYDDILKTAKEGRWMWIGDGSHILSTIHVDNLSAAVKAAIQKGRGGQIYYVSDGEQRPLKAFFTEILRAEGIEPGNRSLPRGLALVIAHILEFFWKLLRLKTRPPMVPVMIYLMGTEFSLNDTKARTELGYRNAVSIDEGLRQMRMRWRI